MANNLLKEEKEKLIILFSNENFNDVIEFSKKLMVKYKKDKFLFNIEALSLYRLGKIKDSQDKYIEAIKLFPDSSDLYFNLGNIQLAENETDDALKNYKKAIKFNSKNVKALFNLANLFHKKSDIVQAEEFYKKIIEIEPDNHKTHNNLGNLYKIIGNFQKGIEHIQKAIAINGNIGIYYINLAAIKKEINENDEAIKLCFKALEIDNQSKEAYYNLAICYQEIGEIKKSTEYFKKANNIRDSKERYLYGLYFNEIMDEFYEEFNKTKDSSRHSSLLQALSNHHYYAFSEDLDYKFCQEGLKYIYLKNLNNNSINKDNFHNELILLSKNKLKHKKNQKLLTNGLQSGGNIFLEDVEPINTLKKIILNELENYRKKFHNNNDLLFLEWPKEFSLNGWFVEIESQGYLKPHIHERGWISGSYYIKMPKIKRNNNQGAISFGYDNDDFNKKITNKEEKIINPQEGDLILFPSSLYHKTLPFEGNEKRICIAFDMNFVKM